MTWFTIAVLGVMAVASLWPRTDSKGIYRYVQFGMLAVSAIIFLPLVQFVPVNVVAIVLFAALWLGAFIYIMKFAKGTGNKETLAACAVGLAIVLSPIGISYGSTATSSPSAQSDSNVGGKEAWKQAPAGTGTTPEGVRDPRFVQKWDPNTEYRFASNGLWDNPQTHEITAAGANNNQKTLVAQDARYLAGSAWVEGLQDDPNKVAPLLTADKTYLSVEGLALYQKLVNKWDSAASMEITKASANGVNTGSNNGAYVVNQTSGISGDLTSLKRSYADGTETTTLARCGNAVLPSKPHGVPPGETDEKPPKETTSTTPSTSTVTTTTPTTETTTTTPETSTTTTTPETSTTTTTTDTTTTDTTTTTTNPKGDVPYPTDKPPVESPPGDPESEAPVEPNPADPTDQPGDPVTDVPAPGATEEPTQEPVPTVEPTGGAEPTDPNQGDVDPDAAALLGLGFAACLGIGGFLRQRRVREH
jgi:hypothetical protein